MDKIIKMLNNNLKIIILVIIVLNFYAINRYRTYNNIINSYKQSFLANYNMQIENDRREIEKLKNELSEISIENIEDIENMKLKLEEIEIKIKKTEKEIDEIKKYLSPNKQIQQAIDEKNKKYKEKLSDLKLQLAQETKIGKKKMLQKSISELEAKHKKDINYTINSIKSINKVTKNSNKIEAEKKKDNLDKKLRKEKEEKYKIERIIEKYEKYQKTKELLQEEVDIDEYINKTANKDVINIIEKNKNNKSLMKIFFSIEIVLLFITIVLLIYKNKIKIKKAKALTIIIVFSFFSVQMAYGQQQNSIYQDIKKANKIKNIISAGDKIIVAIKKDGTVVINDSMGQYIDLSSWKNIKAISCAYRHVMGLKQDGTIVVGTLLNKEYPECRIPNKTQLNKLAAYERPSKWENIIYISAGNRYSAAINNKGKLALSSGVGDGGLSSGKTEKYFENIIEVSVGEKSGSGSAHIAFLEKDGTVMLTGQDIRTDYIDDWENIVSISSGDGYTIGLNKDGVVFFHNISNNILEEEFNKHKEEWKNIIAISAGWSHMVGLKRDGTIISLGNVDVSSWKDIIAISAGKGITIGLKKDGTIVCSDSSIDMSQFKSIDLPIVNKK